MTRFNSYDLQATTMSSGPRPGPCRWAALSLSTIASTFLPDLLAKHETSDIEHSLVAVSTTSGAERAAEWLTKYEIPNVPSIAIYDSWREMLEHGDFDIVYISTPHTLHYEHVKEALTHRRNVLVEKPATMNRQQYSILVQLAKDQGVVMMEAMWTRYLPATLELQRNILPRIGEVKRVFSDFSFPIVSPDITSDSRFLDKRAGAGSLLDQGVYALTWADIALHDQDTATKVVSATKIDVPDIDGEVDDINTLVLSKKREACPLAIGIVTTSMTITGTNRVPFYRRLGAQKQAPSVRIEGTKASVSIPFPPIRPQELHVQWYGERLDSEGMETTEVISKPVEGWGLWYQADVMWQRIRERRQSGNDKTNGEVIGEEESLRVLGMLDDAIALAGIRYDADLMGV